MLLIWGSATNCCNSIRCKDIAQGLSIKHRFVLSYIYVPFAVPQPLVESKYFEENIIINHGLPHRETPRKMDLPICSPWTFRENHSPNIIYTVNRRNQPTAMDLYFLDWVRTRYKTEPEAHTKSAHTVL